MSRRTRLVILALLVSVVAVSSALAGPAAFSAPFSNSHGYPNSSAALTSPALTTVAKAMTPGTNGLIAFTRYRLQDNPLWSEIYVANPDGTGARRVSSSRTAVMDSHAQWSPDGKRILFDRCTTNVCTIWLVDADGTHQRRLTAACPSDRPPPVCSDDSFPSFAPDGRHIVFVHASGRIGHYSTGDWVASSEIVWRDLRGGKLTILRRLAGFRGDYEQPQVSPDGVKLSFRIENSSRARRKNGKALFVANLDGNNQRRITPWSLRATSATWAPDGSRILFASNALAGNLAPGTNLYTARPDGTDMHPLTNVGASHYVLAGSYSPDGTSITYATDLDATPNPLGSNTFPDIVTQPLAGGSVTRITHSANLDGWPTWGPAAGS
jgi:Tol biopolymer transport system component